MTMPNKAEVTLGYGASGTRKTSMIGELAEYIFDKTGKVTRLVTADGGGYDVIRDYAEAGLVKVWHVAQSDHPIEAIDMACQGYWPNQATQKYTKDGLGEVGAYAFEGLTSFGDLIMQQLRKTKARLSQDPSYVFKDGNTEYAGGNMTYYGFVQDRLYDLVMKTHLLPVEKVYWTALEAKGEEEGTKVPTFGPAIAGRKSIGKAPQWFGDCLHFEMLNTPKGEDKVTKQLVIEAKPVMYLSPHADKNIGIPFPAKTRIPAQYAAEVPLYLDPPSLRRLYELQDSFRKKGIERLLNKVQSRIAAADVATQ